MRVEPAAVRPRAFGGAQSRESVAPDVRRAREPSVLGREPYDRAQRFLAVGSEQTLESSEAAPHYMAYRSPAISRPLPIDRLPLHLGISRPGDGRAECRERVCQKVEISVVT